MPRRARQLIGGEVYHVLNRAVARIELFHRDQDYQAFLDVLRESYARTPSVRVLSFCVMPNHWHMVLWPQENDILSDFMFWLTMTHVQRWRTAHHTIGYGPLYQGRFKAFPVQSDEHFLAVCRYVERNPLRAGLVTDASVWRWGSLWMRQHGEDGCRNLLSAWPVERPRDWLEWVASPQSVAEEEALQTSISRNRPYGDENWQKEAAERLGLPTCFRARGRPRKDEHRG
jgi:putative transposase